METESFLIIHGFSVSQSNAHNAHDDLSRPPRRLLIYTLVHRGTHYILAGSRVAASGFGALSHYRISFDCWDAMRQLLKDSQHTQNWAPHHHGAGCFLDTTISFNKFLQNDTLFFFLSLWVLVYFLFGFHWGCPWILDTTVTYVSLRAVHIGLTLVCCIHSIWHVFYTHICGLDMYM